MSDDRTYLRSLGFTVGERGRFSKEMLEALKNRDKAETDSFINDMNEAFGLPPRPEPVREAQELYGLTKDGHKVGFIICSSCADHMMWCECPQGITAPDNVAYLAGVSKDIAILHPRMVQLTTSI